MASVGSVILVECTGSFCVLGGGYVWLAATTTWSTCGQYLMVDGKTREGAVRCALWDTTAKVQVKSWKGRGPAALKWSPACCTLFAWRVSVSHSYVRGVRTIPCASPVSSWTGFSITWVQSPDQKISGLQLSPCGSLIVLNIESQDAMTGHATQLCHVDCSSGADMRSLMHVAAFGSPALPSTSTWHPSPKAPLLYVVACEDRSVHLIDRHSHRCLSSWSSEMLAPIAHFQDLELPSQIDVTLQWSKDGHFLAVLLKSFALIVAFD